MNITIALAQFIMIALAAMASRILVNSGAVSATSAEWSDRAATLVATQGLWLLIIPAAWFFVAEGVSRIRPAGAPAIQAAGVAITVLILAGIALMFVL